MHITRRGTLGGLTLLAATGQAHAAAKGDPELDKAAAAALKRLISGNAAAREISAKATAVLIFPKIVKVGFILGGAFGEGELRQGNNVLGYYNTAAASYGLQAGAQWYGYALFFMNDAALKYLDQSDGFEIGVGPSVVVVDKGVAGKMTSTTLSQDVYAFIFGQKGLMAGLTIEGTKVSRIEAP